MTEEKLLPLTSEQVSRLRKTFRSINAERLPMRFYTSLFARYPNLKHLFPSDLSELSTKIVSVLELVVFSFKEQSQGEFYLQKELLRPLKTLGQLHAQKGVENKFYPLVNEVLLESIKIESHEFPAETELAWKLALNHLTFAMLSGEDVQLSDMTIRDSYEQIKSLLLKTRPDFL